MRRKISLGTGGGAGDPASGDAAGPAEQGGRFPFFSSRLLLVLARKFRGHALLLAKFQKKKKVLLLRVSVDASCRFGFWDAGSARPTDQ